MNTSAIFATWTTSWVERGAIQRVTAGCRDTLNLLRRLARRGVKAKSVQDYEPKAKGGTYRLGDGRMGWELVTIKRTKGKTK